MPPHWSDNFQRLQETCRRSGGLHDAADVLHELQTDNTKFWRASPNSFLVGEIVTYPRRRILNYWLAGGDLKEVLAFSEEYKPLARAAGCDAVFLTGRPGWERVLAAKYRRVGVIMKQDV